MDRWNYTSYQLQQYDWHTYHKIYTTSTHSIQVFMVKILAGWLPVRHQLNKMSTDQQTCPLCTEDETIAHLFQCPHRKQWQQQFLHQLTGKLQQLKISQELQQHIHHNFTERLENTDQFCTLSDFTIFAGLLPLQWKIQDQQTHASQHTKVNNRWFKQFGIWLTQQSHELWLQRNNTVHKNNTKNTTTDNILNQRIQFLYQLQDQVGHHDRAIFDIPGMCSFTLDSSKKWRRGVIHFSVASEGIDISGFIKILLDIPATFCAHKNLV